MWFFSFLSALISIATAAPDYRIATPGEVSRLNGICTLTYGSMMDATGSWIKRPGAPADGSAKAWVLSAGHTAIYAPKVHPWLFNTTTEHIGWQRPPLSTALP